jgi:hypothetical protein
MATTYAMPRTLNDAEVEQLDPYAFFAVLGKRIIHPGGRTATEKLIARAEFAPGQQVLDVEVETGPFDMTTPGGFLHDEGLGNAVTVMARALSRLCYARKMVWLVPRVARAVPYLGYVLISGTKPPKAEAS